MSRARPSLLPCPFCGKPPTVLPVDPATEGNAWTRIVCDNGRCGATAAAEHFAERGHFAAAAKKWNRRSTAHIRQAVADYMHSEGCTCCRDYEAHREHEKRLGEMLDVPAYSDGSGYDFAQFRTAAGGASR